MPATATLDKAGRVVIPRAIREKLHLKPGARLTIETVGDQLHLSEAPQKASIGRRRGRRVITGWEGFDAAETVDEMRRQRMAKFEAPHGK